MTDYNDIDKIAEMLTDDIRTNGGMVDNIKVSHNTSFEPSRDLTRYSSEYSSQPKTVKSVTLLEMEGYHCVAAKQTNLHAIKAASRPHHAPKPQAPASQPHPRRPRRILEL